MKKYSFREINIIEENYEKKFGCLPHTPIGFGVAHIADLMEEAIIKGEPLKIEEYEKRFHYKKDNGVIY